MSAAELHQDRVMVERVLILLGVWNVDPAGSSTTLTSVKSPGCFHVSGLPAGWSVT